MTGGTTIPTAPQAPRRAGRRRSEQAHAAILDATVELLREVGYLQLTVQAVANRAHVGKPTIYRRWPTKRALVIDATAPRNQPTTLQITGNTRVDLRAAIQATLDSYTNSPLGETILAVAVDLGREPPMRQYLQALVQPHHDTVATILRQATTRSELPADVDEDLLQDICTGTLLYCVLLSRRPTDAVIEQLLDFLLDGHRAITPRHEPPDK